MGSLLVLQRLSASAEFRDKLLKAIQYAAKLAIALLNRSEAARSSQHVSTLQLSAKTISTARRFVTLLRWVKYADGVKAAREEEKPELRCLMYSEICLSTVVDALQDLVTLDRIGAFGKPGRLPGIVELLANNLDVVLAANGIVATGFRLARVG
ncbi:MAG: hypothetical protein SGPRY_008436, partial [Prymnesium sp.]